MILLTGATGFVGKSLLKKLTDKNIKVKCLVRNRNKLEKTDKIEIFEGDLLDAGSLIKAVADCEEVIHLAAKIKSSNRKELMNMNIAGAVNLIKACKINRVKRIIFMSSLDAGLGRTNEYGRTKLLVENIVKRADIDFIILRPALIYGKDSKDINMLRGVIRNFPIVPVIGNGKARLQPIYVEDVCEIVIKILESNNKNKTYYVAGEEKVTMNDLIDRIAALYSKRIFKLHLPVWLLFLPLKILSCISKKVPDYESLKLMTNDKICDMSKIEKDLKFKCLKLEEGLRRAI